MARVREPRAVARPCRRPTAHADRVGPPGPGAASDDVRAELRGAPRRPHAGAPVRPDVPYAVGAPDDAAARAGRLRRRCGPRRLSGASLGRPRRCLDHSRAAKAAAEERVKKPTLTAETAETAWFDRLTMSAHRECRRMRALR